MDKAITLALTAINNELLAKAKTVEGFEADLYRLGARAIRRAINEPKLNGSRYILSEAVKTTEDLPNFILLRLKLAQSIVIGESILLRNEAIAAMEQLPASCVDEAIADIRASRDQLLEQRRVISRELADI